MKGHRFFIVDVFGEEKYAGNQLAVVAPQGKLPSAEMQRIAFEASPSGSSDRACSG